MSMNLFVIEHPGIAAVDVLRAYEHSMMEWNPETVDDFTLGICRGTLFIGFADDVAWWKSLWGFIEYLDGALMAVDGTTVRAVRPVENLSQVGLAMK